MGGGYRLEVKVVDRSNSRAVGVYRQVGRREINKIKKVLHVCTNCPSDTQCLRFIPHASYEIRYKMSVFCRFDFWTGFMLRKE